MSAVEVGIRVDLEDGVQYFGLEEVNRRIARGQRVMEVRPAGAVMRDGGDDSVTLAGCQIQIVFEDA